MASFAYALLDSVTGFSVAFCLLEELPHEMRKDADVAPQRLRRNKCFNVAYRVQDLENLLK